MHIHICILGVRFPGFLRVFYIDFLERHNHCLRIIYDMTADKEEQVLTVIIAACVFVMKK